MLSVFVKLVEIFFLQNTWTGTNAHHPHEASVPFWRSLLHAQYSLHRIEFEDMILVVLHIS